MLDNIMVLPIKPNMTSVPQAGTQIANQQSVEAGTPASGMITGSVPEGTGENGSPTTNFAAVLQTIISGLDQGTVNLKSGTFINADGKTVSLAELMQGLLNNNGAENKTGPAKKTDSGNGMADLLQQMISQLQASVAQPVISIAPGQSLNTASSDTSIAATGSDGGNGTGNGMTALIAALEKALQKSDVPAASAGESFQYTAAQQNVTDNAAAIDSNPTPGVISDLTNGVSVTTLSSIAQQNLSDNAANNDAKQTPDAINGTTNSVDVTVLSGIAQQNLTNNTGSPTPNLINAANKTGSPTTNLINAADNAGSPTTNLINAADNAGTPTTNLINAANNAGNPTTNTTNAMNSATPGAKGVEATVLYVMAQKNSDNNTDATTLNAERSTLCAAVSVQQTAYTENAKPVQETVEVSRLSDVSAPIIKTLGSGDSNLTIKLSPPDMGTIQIKLKMENGVLTADFKVDSSAVKDMFTTVMPQIKQSIESSGIKTGNFFTDLKEDSFTEGKRQQDTNQQQQKQNKEQESNFFDYFA